MCLRAAIDRPLRSKRAITSPVSRRPNASGLTRIRVRLTSTAGGRSRSVRPGTAHGGLLARGGRLARSAVRAALPGLGRRGAGGTGGPRCLAGARWSALGGGRPGCRRGAAAAAATGSLGRWLNRARDLGLAVGAQRPPRVERAAAARARLLELGRAARAA